MKKLRKKSTIIALKRELNYYKSQLYPVNIISYDNRLKHLRLTSIFSPEEVKRMPKDILSDLLINRITREFENNIKMLPIKTSYDEYYNIYRAQLDLWVNDGEDYL